MSTRCKIGIMGEGGKIRGVYCHHDGYPSHVGALLLRYYNQPDGINKLISLGSLDSLGSRLDGKRGNITQAFHRDLGEVLVIDEYGSEAEFNKKDWEEEFVYLYKDNDWYVNGVLLTRKIIRNNEIEEDHDTERI